MEQSWPKISVSNVSGEGSEILGEKTFEALGILRVYSKQPGKPADRELPFTVRRGSTVGDLARMIHKEVAQGLKFARVWGAHVFDGQKVTGGHVLEEGDVVEIHL